MLLTLVSECLVSEGVKELFCLCSKGELNKYRVPKLLQELTVVDINVHHTPFPDGLIPSTSVLVKMVEDLRVLLMNGRKTVIQ
jgi:cyclin-dependent kinase inhibitor 3